ncbi:MAG: DUF433 domain-containing protein [Ktedonobacterales bacterium]
MAAEANNTNGAAASENGDVILAPGIVRNPLRRRGKPTIAGTRIAVEDVLHQLIAADRFYDDVLAAYGHLSHAQIRQAINFAIHLTEEAQVPPTTEQVQSAATHLSQQAEGDQPGGEQR